MLLPTAGGPGDFSALALNLRPVLLGVLPCGTLRFRVLLPLAPDELVQFYSCPLRRQLLAEPQGGPGGVGVGQFVANLSHPVHGSHLLRFQPPPLYARPCVREIRNVGSNWCCCMVLLHSKPAVCTCNVLSCGMQRA